jgi:16S rRNA (cytidine1402-2'-O)-methyltransferase
MAGSLAGSEAGQLRRGALYVVSTPIGNLDDMTVRAVNTLKGVGVIAAEDTRRTAHLLRHFGIATPTTSLHQHNETEKLPALLEKLAAGIDVALVSDAGTPLVSDPGRRLIAAAIERGNRVVPIPGPSAVLTALAACGYPADQFIFAGFAPSRSKDRKQWVERLRAEPGTVIFFEAPHRIRATLGDIADLLGDRPITIARELTKLHEEIIHTTARQAKDLSILDRGEFTIVVGPHSAVLEPPRRVEDKELQVYFDQITNIGRFSRRQAITETAAKFGLSTNDVYERLERHKASDPP